MPRRDNSSEGSNGRRKPSGRSGARTNSSRPDSRSERSSRGGDSKKTFKSARGESKDSSKPRRSYERKNEPESSPGNFRKRSEGSGFSRSREDRDDVKRSSTFNKSGESNFKRRSEGPSRDEKPFRRSREEGDDKKRTSRYSGGDSKDFSKPRKSYDRRDDSQRPSREEGFKRRSEGFSNPAEKPFRRSREDESGRDKFSDKEDRGDKKSGFFSKLSRGGKSFTRKAAPAPEYGAKIEKAKEDLGSDKIRLNRYIANSGMCSRREADELIKMGLVTVNGTVVTEMGHKVSRKDVIKYDGKTLRAEKPVYVLMNKPKGFLTTTKDPQERNTVMQIIADSVKERVYPVGRLDRNTTGLLLLTNDGELADKLMHPSHNVKKIYKVDLDKPITKADFEKIKKGVHLEEGKAIVDDLAIVSPDNKTIGIEIHIGWNRVIRRIFESLGYEVVKLDRSVYAGLDKKDLSRGHWRHLTREEVVRLKHYQ